MLSTLNSRVRDLKTNKIGKLCSLKATVTRTSEVKPELLYGTFQCMDCRILAKDIQQQFKYTEVFNIFLLFFFMLKLNSNFFFF